MTGYERDVIKKHAALLMKLLSGSYIGEPRINGELEDVLSALSHEYNVEQIDHARAALHARSEDRAKKGRLVKSTDPRKRHIMEWCKGSYGADKITNVRETEFYFKAIPHFRQPGRKSYHKGPEIIHLKTDIL